MHSDSFLSYSKKRKISQNDPSLSVTRCHSLSLVAIRYHSLSLVVPFFVTRCYSLYHSLSFAVTRSHSLSVVVPLVVTRYIPRLSFYKRSYCRIFSTFLFFKKKYKFQFSGGFFLSLICFFLLLLLLLLSLPLSFNKFFLSQYLLSLFLLLNKRLRH